MRFAGANGAFLQSYSFGWDATVAVYSHSGTYSVVIKDNHYSEVGSYCNDESFCPADRNASNPAFPEEYFVTQLSPTLAVEWKYKNTNTQSCTRSEEHTSELQSPTIISYAVFCLKKQKNTDSSRRVNH